MHYEKYCIFAQGMKYFSFQNKTFAQEIKL